MFDRFTDRARTVMQLANQEAQRFNHEYIGTEHQLLGLIKEGSGTAANVLRNLNVDLRSVRAEVEKAVQAGPDMPVQMGKLPMTPRAKKVVEYAMDHARKLGHNYVGTEHLLLGLLDEIEGVASYVLRSLGVTLESARNEVLSVLGHGKSDSTYQTPPYLTLKGVKYGKVESLVIPPNAFPGSQVAHCFWNTPIIPTVQPEPEPVATWDSMGPSSWEKWEPTPTPDEADMEYQRRVDAALAYVEGIPTDFLVGHNEIRRKRATA